MTLTQYNTTVGHTGIARLCLAQKCYRTRTKLAEVGKPPPLQVGEDVTETYLAGDTFNEAQKEFLIKCLEEGDTVEEMKTYASASLTPAMMQRLRQVRKKRRGQ